MNWYLDVIKNKYAQFTGRSRRKEFWMFVLFNFLVGVVLAIVDRALGLNGILNGVYTLAILVPAIALWVRRLHDIGKSGWWVLIGLIPFIGAIVLIVFAVQDSNPGANEYGENPKGVTV